MIFKQQNIALMNSQNSCMLRPQIRHGTSETLKKLYCLNLTKQQEREYKSQQRSSTYHWNRIKNFSQCSNLTH